MCSYFVNMKIKSDDFANLISSLKGERISHAWKGHGSAVFLELGKLADSGRNPRGDSTIALEWDWRIEDTREIIGGSTASNAKIADLVRYLNGQKISSIDVSDPPHELCITLNDKTRIRTISASSGSPRWTIRLADDRWLLVKSGELVHEDGSSERSMTESERAISDHAEETTLRWGRPETTAYEGNCRDCQSFVYLDGNFHLLDFGVCTLSLIHI